MKNFIFFFTSLFVFVGCDRLQVDKTSQIQIKLPQAVQLQSYQSVSAMNGSAITPTGFVGEFPINCYVVGASGPEESLRQNTCGRTDGSTDFKPFSIGTWVGGVIAGSTLSLDVPSGKDRVIFVVGFHAASAAACRDFRTYGFPEKTDISDPYLLGEIGQLELIPGETKDLPIPISFSTEKRFDNCKGPDFPDHNTSPSNPTSPGNSPAVPSILSIAKNWFPADIFVESSCQGFELRLSDANGYWATFGQDIQIVPQVKFAGTPQSIYKNYIDCINNTPTPYVVIPAGSNFGQVVFKTLSNSTNPVVELGIQSTTSPSPLSIQGGGFFNNVTTTSKSADLEGPDRMLPGLCYEYSLNLKNLTSGLDSTNPSMQVNFNSSNNVAVYESQTSCMVDSGAISFAIFSTYSPSKTLYLKKSSSDSLPATFNFTFPSSPANYIATSKKIGHGSGTTTILGGNLWGDNTLGFGTCYFKPHTIYAVNENGTPVVSSSNVTVNFTTTGPISIGFDNICSTSQISGSVTIPAGKAGTQVWIKMNATGPASVTLSVGPNTPRTMNLIINP